MDVVISVLIILCCIILILAVLVQNPKGGGLASGFQGGSQVMGVRRTADFLEKASWVLAIFLFLFSIWATSRVKKAENDTSASTSITKDKAADYNTITPTNPSGTASPFGTQQTPPTTPPTK
ncbi:MAG TPA: preprotein translocase subunit SecG [Bacteroidia bacterium]|jgi:preprotein translocase subunit SecG|nr:preprotein translocase subunit SecG [Bacteroidia bacterium]